MIPFLGSAFGLSSPLILAALPLAGGFLFWVYRRKGSGQRVKVATTLLLSQLKRTAVARRKFVPPLRFWLELIIFILLSLAAAGLFREGGGGKIALLVDTSFSMSARDAESSTATDLIAIARREAKTYLSSLASDAEVELFSSAPLLTSLSAGLNSPTRSIALLDSLQYSYAEDDISRSLSQIAERGIYDSVFVISDRQLSGTNESKGIPIQVRTLGSQDRNVRPQNVAFTNISSLRNPDKPEVPQIKLGLKAYSLSEVDVQVLLEEVVLQSSTPVFRSISTKKLSLKPNENSDLIFSDLSSNSSTFKVTLTLPGQAQSIHQNSISDDDVAWISLDQSSKQISLVSDLSPPALGLDRLRNLEFVQVKPDQYQDFQKSPEASRISAWIFHRTSPTTLPAGNSLFILPPTDSTLFPSGRELNAPEITRWLESHPALAYLNMPALILKSARLQNPPIWASPLISTSQGPISFAGETAESRVLVTGFEIFPFEGRKAPLLTVFTLNVFKWLSQAAAESGYRSTQSRFEEFPGLLSLNYIGGESLSLSNTKGTTSKQSVGVLLPHPGLVRVQSNGNTSSQIIAVNFFSEVESDTLNPHSISRPIAVARTSKDSLARPLAGTLASYALMLLCLDLLLALVLPYWKRRRDLKLAQTKGDLHEV